MIKRIAAIIVFMSLAGFSSLASADTIAGFWNPQANSAEFSWHINAKGFLIVSVTNTSDYSALISGLHFDAGDEGSIAALVDVDGTRRDRAWRYATDARACFRGECVVTGGNFLRGRGGAGIEAGTTAQFRFVGDFTNVTELSRVIVRFKHAGQRGRGRDAGWGCWEGCGASNVPEPGILVLFGTGLLGIGASLAWRRRQNPGR
jgi:hypothetical protein